MCQTYWHWPLLPSSSSSSSSESSWLYDDRHMTTHGVHLALIVVFVFIVGLRSIAIERERERALITGSSFTHLFPFLKIKEGGWRQWTLLKHTHTHTHTDYLSSTARSLHSSSSSNTTVGGTNNTAAKNSVGRRTTHQQSKAKLELLSFFPVEKKVRWVRWGRGGVYNKMNSTETTCHQQAHRQPHSHHSVTPHNSSLSL